MISVCIPTYNGAKYIHQQVNSILDQLSQDDELVISDDSSTDNTIEIIKSFQDSRIKLYQGNCFYSPIYNMENALKKCHGEYIFMADQDDIWLPNKVMEFMKYLAKNDLVVSDCYVVDNNGVIIYDSFFTLINSGKGFLKNFIKNSFLGCCMAFNRKILDYVLPFPKSIAMHDIWIGLNAELIGKTYFISNRLIYYRRHGGNVSNASEVSKYALSFKMKYRLVFILEICKRWYQRNLLGKSPH